MLALTMHDATEECSIEASDQGRPLDLDCFYLDDGVLCGPQRSVAEYAKSSKEGFMDMDLAFADDQRDVYPAIANPPGIEPCLFPGYAVHDHSNLVLVGCPMGTDEFIREHVREKRSARTSWWRS